MKPAMTEDEWKHILPWKDFEARTSFVCEYEDYDSGWIRPECAHQAAALCLHEQPFGFTEYEANTLESIIPLIENLDRHGDGNRGPVLAMILAKIRSLLPPPTP